MSNTLGPIEFISEERKGQVVTALNALFPRLNDEEDAPLSDDANALEWITRWALSQLKEHNRRTIMASAEVEVATTNSALDND